MLYDINTLADDLSTRYACLNTEPGVKALLNSFHLKLLPIDGMLSYTVTPYGYVMVNINKKSAWLLWAIKGILKDPKNLHNFMDLPQKLEGTLSFLSKRR